MFSTPVDCLNCQIQRGSGEPGFKLAFSIGSRGAQLKISILRQILILVLLSQSVTAFGMDADIDLSPVSVNSSALRIIIANDQRTSKNPDQTEYASSLLTVGIGSSWYTQYILAKYQYLFSSGNETGNGP